MKVRVDPDLCTGCALCADECPEVFELEDDVAEVKVDEVPVELEEACRLAAEECPTEAIIVEE